MDLGIGLGLAFIRGAGVPAATGPTPDILLDFVNNIYRVDGTTYATAALAGWTGTGTFDANGYTAASGQRIVNTINLGTNFIVCAGFATPTPMAQDRILWSQGGAGIIQQASATPILTLPATVSYPSANLVSFGIQGGVVKSSGDNSAVTTGGAGTPPGSAAFGIGNFATGATTSPWGVPIKKIAIYKQVLTDAEIQALT